jgi:hypothetical protein
MTREESSFAPSELFRNDLFYGNGSGKRPDRIVNSSSCRRLCAFRDILSRAGHKIADHRWLDDAAWEYRDGSFDRMDLGMSHLPLATLGGVHTIRFNQLCAKNNDIAIS